MTAHPLLFTGIQLISETPEIMTPVSPEEVFGRIRSDKDLKAQIAELARAKTIDSGAYKKMKTRLPYLVAGRFEGNLRNTRYFQYAQFWILDLDHCLSAPVADRKLKEKIKADPSVMLMFVSPGGDGLKVLFLLEPECASAEDFAVAYKSFATQFAEKLELEGVVDLRTSDVSRACFLSFDPDAWFCPAPQPVDWRAYLTDKPTGSERGVSQVRAHPVVDKETLTDIRQLLNPQTMVRRSSQPVFQPEQLKKIELDLVHAVEEAGLIFDRTVPLNYGLKMTARREARLGEINVFYGKKGFSLVVSPKSGTCPEVNQLLYQVLERLLFREENVQLNAPY